MDRGEDLSAWSSARVEFLKLTGPCPLLPDFAYGTWFTYWHSYTEAEARGTKRKAKGGDWGGDLGGVRGVRGSVLDGDVFCLAR